MSIKTLRKRIALVAVSALGAGLISVVAAPVANAAATDGRFGALTRATAAGTICYQAATSGGAEVTDGTVAVAVVTVGSDLDVALASVDTAGQVATLSNGQILSGNGGGAAAGDITAGGSLITLKADSTTMKIRLGATGTSVLSLYASSTSTTVLDKITFSVVTTCSNTTAKVDLSLLSIEANGTTTAIDNVDASPFVADEGVGYVAAVVKNAYNVVVPAGGTYLATATGDAVVGITTNASAPTVGLLSSATATGAGTDIRIAVAQKTSGTALRTTVSLFYNGTLIGQKNLIIVGDTASIKVNSVEVGRTGTTTYRVFKASAYDAAGNRVSVNPTVDGTTLDQNVTNADIGTTSYTDDVQNSNFITCAVGAKGSTNVKFKFTNNAGATILSDAIKFSCADTLRTYSASLDKATYVPGDIATLTITYKDINGNVPFDGYNAAAAQTSDDVVQYVNGSNVAPSISGSQMTAVAAPAAGDTVSNGTKTYQFVVGSTEGSYQLAVNLTGIVTDSAKAVPYTVKASTTSVTNAEVLAAIVKLIASINKQIRALQKSLRR